MHNQENCARILMFRGCSRFERNLANQTPYDSAVIAGNHVIADSIKAHKESDTVPIRDRPFYNTKRRSVYIGNNSDTQSNYSLPMNNSNLNSVNGMHYASFTSNSRQSSVNENNMSTLSSSNTTHTLIEWNNSVNSSFSNSITTSSGASNNSNSAALRSRSMPKLDDDDSHVETSNANGSLYAITPATMIG